MPRDKVSKGPPLRSEDHSKPRDTVLWPRPDLCHRSRDYIETLNSSWPTVAQRLQKQKPVPKLHKAVDNIEVLCYNVAALKPTSRNSLETLLKSYRNSLLKSFRYSSLTIANFSKLHFLQAGLRLSRLRASSGYFDLGKR